MKIVPYILSDMPHLEPVEFRFKKHNVSGRIFYRKETNDYVYSVEHPSFGVKKSEEKGEMFHTLEEARQAAEKWIDLWYSVQGRILALTPIVSKKR